MEHVKTVTSMVIYTLYACGIIYNFIMMHYLGNIINIVLLITIQTASYHVVIIMMYCMPYIWMHEPDSLCRTELLTNEYV